MDNDVAGTGPCSARSQAMYFGITYRSRYGDSIGHKSFVRSTVPLSLNLINSES